MKRAAVLALVLAAMAVPSPAVKKISVAQLEQMVATLHGKKDSDAAFRIADVELTERLSKARMVTLIAAVSGDRSSEALAAIADASQFQPPPAEEIPAAAAPDLAAQRRIMGLVANYVSKSIPELPNFIATRVTHRYEDTPLLQKAADGATPYQPLHLVSNSQVTVLYRDGREVEDAPATRAKTPSPAGLKTWGEFGPILATVLLDAAQNKLAWSRWEQGPAGMEAVFSYEVLKEKSHYEVNYCCVAEEAATYVANVHPFRRVAAYRGEIVVDPASGSILRLTLKVALKPGEPVSEANILVDYGPVEIGGKAYMCPVKGVSLTTAQMVQQSGIYNDPLARQLQPLKTMLNEVKFEQYHVFRAESRVMTEPAAERPVQAIDDGAQNHPSGAEAPVDKAGANVRAEARTLQEAREDAGALQNAKSDAGPLHDARAGTGPNPNAMADTNSLLKENDSRAGTGGDSPISSAAEIPEIIVVDKADVPDAPPPMPPGGAPSGFTLRTTTKLVDVGLVAYDKKGHTVTDLKLTDFEIYDNGRRQEIKFFGQASQAAAASLPTADEQSLTAAPEPAFSNRQIGPESLERGAAPENHATVLMIDASNLAWDDLSYARQEILRFLKTFPADEPAGLYILRSYGFQVLVEPTSNHDLVAERLSQWMPTAQDLSRAQDEEQRNRQTFDWVHSAADLERVNGNGGRSPETFDNNKNQTSPTVSATSPVDPRLREMGSNPERDSLLWLIGVARHLGSVAGRKNLIWVSSDNVLADWSDNVSRSEKTTKFLDTLAIEVRETMNEARVSLYPLDASQLEPGGVSTDRGTRNVLAIGKSDRDIALAGLGDAFPGARNGRDTAKQQQDLHSIQGTFRDLAQATGGRALRRAGDIAAELNCIAEDGRAAYLMSFTPDSPADDKYHLITVKLTGRRDLTLRYRTGYLYEKEPATLRQRFQQAVWQARDRNDIALTATPAGSGKDASLKLNIAATDLVMAQAGERWTDRLDIFLVERDDAALHANLNGRTLAMKLQTETYQKALRDGIVVDEALPVKVTGSLRVVVVDENSGRIGSLTIPGSRP